MPDQHGQLFTGARHPDRRRNILTPSHDLSAIGRERCGDKLIPMPSQYRMPNQYCKFIAGIQIPDACGRLPPRGYDSVPIWRAPRTENGASMPNQHSQLLAGVGIQDTRRPVCTLLKRKGRG